MKVEGQVASIEMPWLSAVNVRALPSTAEHIVENDVKRNGSVFAIEKRVDAELNSLKTCYLQVPPTNA